MMQELVPFFLNFLDSRGVREREVLRSDRATDRTADPRQPFFLMYRPLRHLAQDC